MGVYLRPRSLNEALDARAAPMSPAVPRVVLAGGTDHFPALVDRVADLDVIDISGIDELRGIDAQPGGIRIGALATWTDLIEADLPPLFDGLRSAARQIGGVQIQNMGTLAGNLCNASPAADGIVCLSALDAEVEVASARGRRRLAIQEFVVGARRTALATDEIVVALHVSVPAGAATATFEKLGVRSYLVISIVMVAAVAHLDDWGRIARARVAVGACNPVAVRLHGLEAALVGREPQSAAALVEPRHLAPLAPIADVRGPADYRQLAALELVRRAVTGLSPLRGSRTA